MLCRGKELLDLEEKTSAAKRATRGSVGAWFELQGTRGGDRKELPRNEASCWNLHAAVTKIRLSRNYSVLISRYIFLAHSFFLAIFVFFIQRHPFEFFLR